MTIREKLHKYFTERGFFDSDATEVIDMMISDSANEAMEGRWDEDTEGYPDCLFSVLLMSADYAAVTWIDTNKPKHWARPMFVH